MRLGKTTDTFRSPNIALHFPDDCAFSVIFGEAYETLDLVAATPDEANIWVTGLSYLIGGNRSKYLKSFIAKRVKHHFWCFKAWTPSYNYFLQDDAFPMIPSSGIYYWSYDQNYHKFSLYFSSFNRKYLKFKKIDLTRFAMKLYISTILGPIVNNFTLIIKRNLSLFKSETLWNPPHQN